MIRKPVVAGQFYAESFQDLDKEIISCFNSKFGPGDLPVRRGKKRLFGIISPHAGYQYSGPGAAWAFKEVAESKFPSVFVIIGPDHSGYGNQVSTMLSDWATPFGVIKVDKGFCRELIHKCAFVEENVSSHTYEHSLEVQLPFLQFVNKDKLKTLKFVPLVMSDFNYDTCKVLGQTIAKVDEKACVIASSDFTHYGPSYGYVPFVHNVKEGLYSLDGEAIEFIKKLDAKGFLDYKNKKRATICGTGPIVACIEAVKALGAKKGNLLNYYTSGDVIGDYTNAVGYAAVSFD